MTQEDNILSLFEQYFATADKQEIQKDVAYVNSLGKDGISFEQYLENLDSITAFPIAETGVCDDIAYSDYYTNLISAVSMDDFHNFKTIEESLQVESNQSSFFASESTFLLAA